MEIINSTIEDIDIIFSLYDAGTILQKKAKQTYWQGFKRTLIENEIQEGRLWKIVVDQQIVCVFTITFQDPFIWKEKDKDPSVYIHRIATHPDFRGNGYVKKIVAWSKDYAAEHHKQFVRMDTGSGNDKLNNYYISCGFNYLGVVPTGDAPELPAHYRGGSSSLFEIAL
ncbi:MAG: GNAT family N-acetyltransferase [Chitinophaga sp.]|uniref:GNAT family N-acetyltransferase n=1 Tax=Chitinophaga sp. TaxID=1869181 RepID=UPI001B11735F|nr:GNAT family N-acetyltransferase [Chitinophaga sp.]MBO9729382.1 GNAT family N-acetyltransferase [Chitinophaga sp.]